MELDRDSMIVIDFPMIHSSSSSSSCPSSPRSSASSRSLFGGRLERFLNYIPSELCFGGLSGGDLDIVHGRLQELLTGVDFSPADDSSCALVTCMPGGPASLDKGGWLQMVDGLDRMGVRDLDGRLDIATGQS
jgi:hypothetical protein